MKVKNGIQKKKPENIVCFFLGIFIVIKLLIYHTFLTATILFVIQCHILEMYITYTI